MITTIKTKNGTTIKVHNYNDYQTFNKEKKQQNEHHNEQQIEHQSEQIKDNKLNTTKELKELNTLKEVVSDSDNSFKNILNIYQQNIEMNPSQITMQKIGQDFDDYGHEYMKFAIEKSALLNNHNYRFIDWLLKDWRKNQLTTIEAVRQYEAHKEQKRAYSNQQTKTQSQSPYENMELIEPDEHNLPF
ncbi:DnaD domain protein [Macrococcus hajekii]|uniref:DnaD domain protein n=1 Tax=Macrococcus hajekii TaxID=198482 RepID=A0A4R6BNR0_9STAP|nr:DnaD domain protein [Macrococcus hajekii]TDM03418.1 DnaD domain protein [Macrococcus hajekii]